MKNKQQIMITGTFSLLGLMLLILLPSVVLANHGGFHALEGIPGIENPDSLSTEAFVQALYNISIGVAALLVVVRIMIAGVQYMLSEIVTNKEKAKGDIKNAILGLLIILAAVTLLNTINPELTNLNALRNAPAYETHLSTESTSSEEVEKLKKKIEGKTRLGIYTGEYGTSKHTKFIGECLAKGGISVQTADLKSVECWK